MAKISIRKKNPYQKLCINAENRKHSIFLHKLENCENRNLFNTNEDRHKKNRIRNNPENY